MHAFELLTKPLKTAQAQSAMREGHSGWAWMAVIAAVAVTMANAMATPAYVTAAAVPSGATITSCREITQAGNYVIGADLTSSPNSSCIKIHDTANVQLDCQQHVISIDRNKDNGTHAAVAVSNVNGYSIGNCKLYGVNTTNVAWLSVLSVNNSPNGSITYNVFNGGAATIVTSDGTEVGHNTSNMPMSVSGNRETIEYNTISLDPSQWYPGVLFIQDSTGSIIQYNELNGGWDGIVRQSFMDDPGADDGIAVVGTVTSSVIRNNNIVKVWGCGIENGGVMEGVQILNNQITTAGFSGIGGWFGNSLKGVTVSGNTVTDTPMLWNYLREDGLYSGEQELYCQNNVFSGNKLVKPRVSVAAWGSGRVDFQDVPPGIPSSAVVVGNNTVANNDFGPLGVGVVLLPGRGFSDGGGNVCDGRSTPALQCTPPTPPSGGYYVISSYPPSGAAVAPGSQMLVIFGANPGSTGDYAGLAAVGSDDQHFVSSQLTGGATMNTLVFTAPTTPGQYEFRYMKAGGGNHVAASNRFVVSGTSGATISAFTSAPSVIVVGQSAVLSWSVSGAATITIDNGIGDVTGLSSKTVSPSQTTTYNLTASGSGGVSATAQVTVTVNPPADTQPPTVPTRVSANANSPTEIDLAWIASTDNTGVQGYQIIRNGSTLISVTGATLSYSDRGVSPSTTYTYVIKAYDAAGNYSAASSAVSVTTPAQSVSTGCPAPANGAFTGCYYNNTSLSGVPAAVRTDSQISFYDWSGNVPASVTQGNFSASWQGYFTFDAGTYVFVAYTSDGMRLYVDGSCILNQWKDQGVRGYSVRQALTQGSHLIRIEYYDHNSTGQASVYWTK